MTSSLSPGGTTSVSRSVTNPYWYSRLASSATSLGTAGHGAPPVAAWPVISRVVMVVSLLPASVDADWLGFMIPRSIQSYKFYLAKFT